MLTITCIAVIGGLLVGLGASLLLGSTERWRVFAMTGAVSGAAGLLLYTASSRASNQAVSFWWQGITWVAVCVLFALTGVFILSNNRR